MANKRKSPKRPAAKARNPARAAVLAAYRRTRERIAEIEREALRKLRRGKRR